MLVSAEYLRLLREREKAAGLSGDPDTDAFLKASALQGKRHSVVTEYMLKLLGLDVSTASHPRTAAPPCASTQSALHSSILLVAIKVMHSAPGLLFASVADCP